MRSSNIFHKARAGPRGLWTWLSAGLAIVCFAKPAAGLGSNKAISQYLRDHWGTEQGFAGGPVYAFAQTRDGYLWIGTEKGLIRFDGLHFHLYDSADSAMFPAGGVLGLAVDAEGSLWVRLQGPRLLRYRDGKFEDVFSELNVGERNVTAMCVGKDGKILLAGLETGLVRYEKGKFVAIAPRAQTPGLVISLAETADGKVWAGTRDTGLFLISDGNISSIAQGVPDKKINSLVTIDDNEIWIGTDSGLVRWNGREFSQTSGPDALALAQVLAMTKDNDGNLWVGSSKGLIRMDARGISSLEYEKNRRAETVNAVFEDREGNLWVGTAKGIERFRDSVFTTFSIRRGLPTENIGPIYADEEGRTWFAPSDGGLYWLKEGKVGRIADGGLDHDVVYSISGGKGELWLGRQRGGLTHVRYQGTSFATETYTRANGLVQNSVFAVYESRDGAVWAGTLNGGLTRFQNGNFKTYSMKDGLTSNSISSIAEGANGMVWVGTPNGLNAFSKGVWRSYTSKEDIPPGNVNCLLEDANGALWIGTASGLAVLRAGMIDTPRNAPETLREPILGMEEDKTGALWIATANHILRVDKEKLLGKGAGEADVREYGQVDGLGSRQGVKRDRSVVADSLGRIWIATSGGLSFVDPKPMSLASAPALVHVEGISADGVAFPLEELLRIPAPHQRITLSYTGLSLSVPERVRFKYKLEGFDREWSEPTASREASYTNLNSGRYQFHVMASNSEGLWNGAESVLGFDIQPVFWQTWWFLACSVAGMALLLLGLIRLRLLQLTKQMNVRFEERLAERTRIAQDLHDTLLQGVLSASMQLHVADASLPADSPAKAPVGRVLELMRHVIEEGRNVLQGLRSSKRGDLAQAFLQTRQEFPTRFQTGFRVIVEGAPRPLRPMVRDEVYLIGHEALSNAFRHSHATDIEVELEYAASHLRVFVRDNGGGIDPHILQAGRDGHWGLSGMKERTKKIGGELRVLSRAEAGTEIELSVPSRLAFEGRGNEHRVGWMTRFLRNKKGIEKLQTGSERDR